MRNHSQQVTLDSFFAAMGMEPQCWHSYVSDRAFAKARDRLDPAALEHLNTVVLQQAQALGLLPLWHGLRVVAADASALVPAIRQAKLRRLPARPQQKLFSMLLAGVDVTLHACVHGVAVDERQMLFEALEQLGPDDVLVLDRGYPSTWLVALLNERGVRYCIRCDNPSGWRAARQLLRSNQEEAHVTLRVPKRLDVLDYELSGQAATVRLVRVVCPNGRIQVMVTNLPSDAFGCECFADLYHQRWRIEETYKRLKHPMKLEAVSGLSQHAVRVDVAAKVLADTLASLLCLGASVQARLHDKSRVCNRSYAAKLLEHGLARMLVFVGDVAQLLEQVLALLARNTQRRRPGRSQPRPNRHVKPHPSTVYKG